MRNCLFWTLLLALALSPPSTGSTKDKPIKSRTPLSADEIAVYKAVLQQHISRDSGSLNVSVTTYPLDPTSPMNHLSESECLQGIRLENLAEVSHSFHDLTPEVLPAKNIKLVGFATALFSMSEIAFDKEHRNAVVSYSFRCGPRCGYGATLALEKLGSQWKKTKRNCGDWISSLGFGPTIRSAHWQSAYVALQVASSENPSP